MTRANDAPSYEGIETALNKLISILEAASFHFADLPYPGSVPCGPNRILPVKRQTDFRKRPWSEILPRRDFGRVCPKQRVVFESHETTGRRVCTNYERAPMYRSLAIMWTRSLRSGERRLREGQTGAAAQTRCLRNAKCNCSSGASCAIASRNFL